MGNAKQKQRVEENLHILLEDGEVGEGEEDAAHGDGELELVVGENTAAAALHHFYMLCRNKFQSTLQKIRQALGDQQLSGMHNAVTMPCQRTRKRTRRRM